MKILLLYVSLNIFKVSATDDGSFELDLNDILDQNLMPGNLLLIDGPYMNNSKNLIENKMVKNLDDGSILNAISTMRFHRKKINEYLCTNFVAEQILVEVSPISAKLQKRTGSAVDHDDSTVKENEHNNRLDVKENMLFDQGSSGYQNWLSKTTTLEDIYNHYLVKPNIFQNKTQQRANQKMDKMDPSRQDYLEDDYEEGEITGYAFHKPASPSTHYDAGLTSSPITNQAVNDPHDFFTLSGGQFDGPGDFSPIQRHQPVAGSKAGYFPSGHGDSGYDYGVHQYQSDKGLSKEIGLKDIFEIALTTLAFLSFGMFVLHVLMCITMTKTDTNMMMMPLDETPELEAINVAEVRRRKRSVSGTPTFSDINKITKKILKSIEAVLVADQDNGTCLHRVLCENNNFSRNRTDDQKIWIPVWGLGLSWLSSKIISNQPTSSSILESLRASALGLGGADCIKMYPNCDVKIQTSDRILRRERREAETYVLKMKY